MGRSDDVKQLTQEFRLNSTVTYDTMSSCLKRTAQRLLIKIASSVADLVEKVGEGLIPVSGEM